MPAVSHRGRGRRTISEINMVPFIDVMLVLLIIFMVTAPLIAPSVINLPSVSRGAKPPEQIVQVTIGKDEGLELKIDNKTTRMPLKALIAAVKEAQGTQQPGNSAVVIAADKDVRYENVVKVMDELTRAGVQRIALSVKPAAN
jgi:biopolymer transport protein TolR